MSLMCQMSPNVTYVANVTDVSHKSDEFSKACGEVLDRFQFRSEHGMKEGVVCHQF